MHSFGWWTGHYTDIDSISINVGGAIPTVKLSATSVDVTDTLHFDLTNLTPNGTITLYRKLLSTGKVFKNTYKANAKGTLGLNWYISTLTLAGEWQTWLEDTTTNQTSTVQSVQIASNPTITLTANDVNFNLARRGVGVKFKTTAAVLKNVTANLYMGFQLPGGTVLYDNGVSLTRERKPRLANVTIATIEKYQPALGYRFGAKAISGAYSYWAMLENTADSKILANSEIMLSYCATCGVAPTSAMKKAAQPITVAKFINAPSDYPLLSLDTQLVQEQKIALSRQINAPKLKIPLLSFSPFNQYKAAMSGKTVVKGAAVLLDKVLGEKSGYDIVKKAKNPTVFADKIKPFLDSLSTTMPDATVSEEQDTAAMIDLMQLVYNHSNAYEVEFSDKVKNFINILNDNYMKFVLSDTNPQVALAIDVSCDRPWTFDYFCSSGKTATLTIYELLHFECPGFQDVSTCEVVGAINTTPIFSDLVTADRKTTEGHSYPTSLGASFVPMGVYKLVVTYNNKSSYFLCNALEVESYCKAYLP